MTPFMQAWEAAEQARHRALLSQLKREMTDYRSHANPASSMPSQMALIEAPKVPSHTSPERKRRIQPILKSVAVM